MKDHIRALLAPKIRLVADSLKPKPQEPQLTMNDLRAELSKQEVSLAELRQSIASKDTELSELTNERSSYVVGAVVDRDQACIIAMRDLDEKIRIRSTEVRLQREAVASVERRLTHAREALAREQEKQRELEMSVHARIIASLANDFDAHLRGLAETSQQLTNAVRKMQILGTKQEVAWLDRLHDRTNFMRAVESVRLHNLFQMPPYPGPKKHIVALHVAFSEHLSRWLQQPEDDFVVIQKERAELVEAEQDHLEAEPRQLGERVN